MVAAPYKRALRRETSPSSANSRRASTVNNFAISFRRDDFGRGERQRPTLCMQGRCPILVHAPSRRTTLKDTHSHRSSTTSVSVVPGRVEVWNTSVGVQRRSHSLNVCAAAIYLHVVARHASCNALGHDNREASRVRRVCLGGCCSRVINHGRFPSAPAPSAETRSGAGRMECSCRARRSSSPHSDQTGSGPGRQRTAAAEGGVGPRFEHSRPSGGPVVAPDTRRHRRRW